MIIPHRNFEAARNKLRRALQKHRPGRIIMMIGVGGVGKTTLRWDVLRQLYGQHELWGVGHIPVVEAMALLGEKAYFNSKACAEDSLYQLFVPDLSWLTRGVEVSSGTVAVEDAIAQSRFIWRDHPRRLTEPQIWNSFKNVARERQLKIFCLEHASALCVNHKDTSPAHHIINLMSLMESIGSMALLTAIQSGVELWRGRSEIRRRMDVIWVPPYDVSQREEMSSYLSLLRTVGSRYQFHPAGLLADLAPEIAAATAAICGEVVNLLDRAAENALAAGRPEINRNDIEAAYYSKEELETLWADVDAFWAAKRSDAAAAVSARADIIWPQEDAE